MCVELVVAQLDRLVHRVPALVPGGPGFVQGAECFPACLGGLSRLVPEGSLDRGSFLQAGDGTLDALRSDGLPFGGVAVQQRGARPPGQDESQLPAEVNYVAERLLSLPRSYRHVQLALTLLGSAARG
jgi:hypothetical protein